VELGLIFSRPY